MTATEPLRERKKARTAAALLDAADRLFREKGYEETTLEDICDAAEVSVRTFFRYFDSKRDLALARERSNAARIAEGLAEAPRPLTFLRQLYGEIAGEIVRNQSAVRGIRLIANEPSLIGNSLLIDLSIERAIADAVLRAAPNSEARRARLLSAMLVGGIRSTLLAWMAEGRKADLVSEFDQIFDVAEELFPELRA